MKKSILLNPVLKTEKQHSKPEEGLNIYTE